MPLFGMGEVESRIGTPAEVVTPTAPPAVKERLPSVSTVTPAAFRTENVVEPVERDVPAPAVES
jgi:hypothetical protein